MKEFIGVMHKHSYAGFKRLDQETYEKFGFRLLAEYDGYSHAVYLNSYTRDNILTEDEKDDVREFISNFEKNRMKFE